MHNLSVKQKTFFMFAGLILVVLIAGGVIFWSLSKAAEDADITNALGRQRMLSQAMSKDALGAAMAKSRKRTIEQSVESLDRYVTQMRALYTSEVVVPLKKAGVAISMNPAIEKHTAVPFPATLTRMVNKAFGKDRDFTIDIINDDPINPEKGLKTELDKEAFVYLKGAPDKIYSKVYEEGDRLMIGLYTIDVATHPACVSCHTALKGKEFKIGDMIGMRTYRLVFSSDIAVGRSELKASMDDYNSEKNLFSQTLASLRGGGTLTLDPKRGLSKTVFAVEDGDFQRKANEVELKFKEFTGHIASLVESEVNSNPYRMAQQNILRSSNELHKVSDDLVGIYTRIANANQSNIRTTVVAAIIAVVLIGIYIYRYLIGQVIRPIIDLSGVMAGMAEGDFKQEKMFVPSKDEVGQMAENYNTLLDTMRGIVSQAEDIAAGKLDNEYQLKGDLAFAFGKMVQELRGKKAADEKFKELAEERRQHAEDLQKKVDHMLLVVSAAAKGDLTRKIGVAGVDAMGQMGTALAVFFKRLVESMTAISQTAMTLAHSAKEISSAVQGQASVAAQNSASVTEISSTVEELSAASTEVASSSQSVAEIAKNALSEAEHGMNAIDSLNAKMESITEDNEAGIKEIVELGRKSNEIGKVMEIINGIADQTKLIAFNAAIEASSAGEAGKRFGVVAVEIRRLADNVMESTGEIQTKIDEIQQAINRLVITSEKGSKRIHEGKELAGQTFAELEKLVEGAKSAAEAASQISLSTRQQKTATEQVLTALREIVNGAKQSSNAIKQTSSVTAKLSEMSDGLKAMVSKFKIQP
jgi:methyl-accepting chemotaxis protein